jgi:pimeloyl-ACP methyl ester carboxylesterase
MRLRLLRALLPAVVLLLAVAVAVPAAGAKTARCPRDAGFRCSWLTVPLDRSGGVAGSIRLRYAVSRRPRGGPVLLALSGGPGQPSVASAASFATSLDPMLTRYRLAVLDQRGTGASGALRCPTVQRLRALEAFGPRAVAACAERVGQRRRFYTTADTVLDLDALRGRLGVARMALMGISYGTHVALQYARTFPARTDRLILDSVVGPDGPDPFLLDTYRNLPRVLREGCARDACRGITRDPVGDAAALVARLERGPVAGLIPDARAQLRPVSYRSPEEALYLLIAGDLNPFVQAALPAALAAARHGDDALLLRLRRAAQGSPTPVGQLSFGLNVTTGCTDGGTPWPLSTPLDGRRALGEAALAAVPPADYAPFDAATVFESSYGDDCALWPQDSVRAPSTAPLPDVPALVLGGGMDLRTPVQNAIATAALLPRSTVVRLAGAGHDVLDSDVTGCAQRALSRFAADRPVGRPCAGKDNAFPPVPLPPRGLAVYRSAAGVPGRRGRIVSAVLETVQDAELAMLQNLLGGENAAGGGLRGGSYRASATGAAIILRRYSYLAGLRLTGRLSLRSGFPTGVLEVAGRGSGRLTFLGQRGVRGTLDGRAVRYRPPGGASAAGAARAGLRVAGPSLGLRRWPGDRLRARSSRRGLAG